MGTLLKFLIGCAYIVIVWFLMTTIIFSVLFLISYTVGMTER